MQDSKQILASLKEKGHRFARIRKAILDLLLKSPDPLSSPDIQQVLSKKKIAANKTTVYRQLAFLKEQNLIRELQFRDNTKRYEIMPDNHHHHIVCTNCDKIEDVELARDLDAEEKVIAENKKFKVINHSLEFYGICGKCQDKQVTQT
ncbi:MAG: Peroxide operon regulator [Syntrophomonadaceae bacterium]|nr:Peroxide operon regulator [Bacillota bacterium]